MNKRLSTEIIKIICIQAAVLIIAISTVGAAVIVHGEYKKALAASEQTVGTVNVPEKKQKEEKEKKDEKVSSPYEFAGLSPYLVDITLPPEKLLLDAEHSLPENYSPVLSEAVPGSGVMLDSRVVPYYRAMYDAAKESGITLTPISGYRSYDSQKKSFDSKTDEIVISEEIEREEAVAEALKYISAPGCSEHNAGLSVDICSASFAFEYTDAFGWLSKHAQEYGFILRYPKGEDKEKITKMQYQPWHYRFVGCTAAGEITGKDITFEEYVENVK